MPNLAPTVFVSNAPSTGATNTFTQTTTAAIAAGNLLVAGVSLNFTTGTTVSSISDGTNSYAKAVAVSQSNQDTEVWFVANAAAVASGATLTLKTVGNSASGDGYALTGVQVGNAATASALDKTASAHGTSVSTITATTAALSQTQEMAFAQSCIGNPTTYNGATGWTNLTDQLMGGSNNGRAEFEYQLLNAIAALSYAPAWAASESKLTAAVATFKLVSPQPAGQFATTQVRFRDDQGYAVWDQAHGLEHTQFVQKAALLSPTVGLPDHPLRIMLSLPEGPRRQVWEQHLQVHQLLRQTANVPGYDFSKIDLDREDDFYDFLNYHAVEHAQLRTFYGLS